MGGSWPSRAWKLHTASPVTAVLSLVSAAVLIQSVVASFAYLVSPAWHDLWDWVPEYQRWLDGHYGLRDLLAPYYEHRIVLTKVLLLLDSALDGMNGRMVQCVALTLLAAFGWVVWRITRLGSEDTAPANVPPLFWVALACSLAQYENINLPFQVQFPIAILACGLACLLLGRATLASGARAAWLAAAAGVAGIVAAFSMGSGILLAPCLLVMLALRRARPVVWAVFTPLSVLGVVLFFQGHASISQPGLPLLDWHLAVMRTVYSLNFLAAGLGGYPDIATVAGALGLAVFAAACLALVWTFLLRRRSVPAADAALVALGLLVVLCAPAGTLTNRLMLGTDAALASRYGTMSLVFAAALLGLIPALVRPRRPRLGVPHRPAGAGAGRPLFGERTSLPPARRRPAPRGAGGHPAPGEQRGGRGPHAHHLPRHRGHRARGYHHPARPQAEHVLRLVWAARRPARRPGARQPRNPPRLPRLH